jgi:hypothetical protein
VGAAKQHGVYPAELDKWRASGTTALVDAEDTGARPQATRAERKRIKVLERDLLRKDRALAEMAAARISRAWRPSRTLQRGQKAAVAPGAVRGATPVHLRALAHRLWPPWVLN